MRNQSFSKTPKAFGTGRGLSPQELHRALGFRKLCEQCGGPPVVRLKAFMPLDEFVRRDPLMAAMIEATSENGRIPTVMFYTNQSKTSMAPFVKYADICACEGHRKEAEQLAARLPSFCVVEIDRGPDPTQRVVTQVPR